jgi:hypothetical protein
MPGRLLLARRYNLAELHGGPLHGQLDEAPCYGLGPPQPRVAGGR